jgi:hypothetical protein
MNVALIFTLHCLKLKVTQRHFLDNINFLKLHWHHLTLYLQSFHYTFPKYFKKPFVVRQRNIIYFPLEGGGRGGIKLGTNPTLTIRETSGFVIEGLSSPNTLIAYVGVMPSKFEENYHETCTYYSLFSGTGTML